MPASRPPLVIGQYELHGMMSSGGMATVHFGRLVGPVGFSRTVAIKRLHPHFAKDPSFVSMFVDEARLVSRIHHPNVIPTLDVVSTQGELFLVMDYVHGESLSKLLTAVRAQKARISPHIVSAILGGVLRGLHAAHEASHPKTGPLNIVHRDISPQNVLVGVDGSPRILDFGVAKALDRVQELTRDGQLKGKLAYMAPEQFTGGGVTRSVDIWAASVVLWEAITARRLFAAERQVDTIKKILESPIHPPSYSIIDLEKTLDSETHHMLQALDSVVLRGLSRNPVERFSTAREMAHALEAAMPPAAASEVTEWVEHYARDALLARTLELNQLTDPLSQSVNTGLVEQIVSSAPPPTAAPRASRPSLGPPPPPPMTAEARQRSAQTVQRSDPMAIAKTSAVAAPERLSPAIMVFIVLALVAILVSAVLIAYTLMVKR
ncbi:MAG: serine/threonine-protein kinase [Polyangiaceae bacterium]